MLMGLYNFSKQVRVLPDPPKYSFKILHLWLLAFSSIIVIPILLQPTDHYIGEISHYSKKCIRLPALIDKKATSRCSEMASPDVWDVEA